MKKKVRDAYGLPVAQKYAKKPRSQAERIFQKFGGPARLTVLLAAVGHSVTHINVRKWNYPKHRLGSDGIIPSRHWGAIFKAARLDGILITQADLDPRVIDEELEVSPSADMHSRWANPTHGYGVKLQDDEINYGSGPWDEGPGGGDALEHETDRVHFPNPRGGNV